MMKDIDTYMLMLELQKRVSDYAYDPEPVHDRMLTSLCMDNKDNRRVIKWLDSELRILLAKYKDIAMERSQLEDGL